MKAIRRIGCVVVLSLGCQGLSAQTTAWYNREWTHRMKITINQAGVVGTHQNFPVLIAATRPGWRHVAQGGHAGQTNGCDFLFTAGDGVTKLAHEIEGYDPGTGKLTAWVNIPMLSSTSGVPTELYAYYGNYACDPQWNITGTWNANFMMVQHLQETPTNNVAGFRDSTIRNNNGTPWEFGGPGGGTTDAPGRFDGGVLMDGAAHIRCGTGSSLRPNPLTVEFWVNMPATAKTRGARNTFISAQLAYWIFQHESNDYLYFHYWNGSGYAGSYLCTYPNMAANQWYYCAVTYDKNANTATYYLNGTLRSSTTFTTAPAYSAGTFYIGAYNPGTQYYRMAGTMDEVRISNIERSADWIRTTYNSLNSPETFFSLADKAEAYPGGSLFMLR